MLRRIACAPLAVLAFLLLPAAPPASAATRSCGSAGTVDEVLFLTQVKAMKLPCAQARSFARAFETSGGAACETKRTCTFRGWSCRSVGTEDSAILHRCASPGARVVSWHTEEG